MGVRWEHFVSSFDSRYLPGAGLESSGGKHGVYVQEFASIVSIFQDRTDSLIDVYTELTRTIDDLATCAYTPEAFSDLLTSIQKTVDRLNLEGYANLDSWVAELDKKIEAVLLERLRAVIDRWCAEFTQDGDAANRDTGNLASRKKAAEKAKVRSTYSLEAIGLRVDVLKPVGRAGRRPRAQDARPRNQNPEPGHLPRPSHRTGPCELVQHAPPVARRRLRPEPDPELPVRDWPQDPHVRA